MIVRLFLFICIFCTSCTLFAQKVMKFSAEVHYGLNGNFFVRSYDEVSGPPAKRFSNKNFIGSIGGAEIKYRISKKANLGFAYSASVNKRTINYQGVYYNLTIRDWKITHTDKFFQLYYERDFSRKAPAFKYGIGLFYLRSNQQEVEIADYLNGGIFVEERNYKSYKLEEAGAFIGIQYSKYIDTKFELGIKTRAYYLISTNELNNIMLTPVLLYHF